MKLGKNILKKNKETHCYSSKEKVAMNLLKKMNQDQKILD